MLKVCLSDFPDWLSLVMAYAGNPRMSLVSRSFYQAVNASFAEVLAAYSVHSALAHIVIPIESDNPIAKVQQTYKKIMQQAAILGLRNVHQTPLALADVAQQISDHNLCIFFKSLVLSESAPDIQSPDAIREWLKSNLEFLSTIHLLNISQKEITEIPPEIALLTGLKHIEIIDCQLLKEFPDSIIDISKLRTLSIKGCTQLFLSDKIKKIIKKLKHFTSVDGGVFLYGSHVKISD